ncbi:MAG: bile acid:sodium symporter [Pseudomonadota bacterium]
MDFSVAVLLPLGVVIIMFSLGLGLRPADFQRILDRPRAFCIGALNQVILLPIIAYCVVLAFGFTRETAVGIMILAACPGGAVSNIVTKLANWDVALSVTLTATFSLTCVVTIPLILNFAMNRFMGEAAPDIEILSTALVAFLLTALPITLGVALRAAAPSATAKIEPVLARLAALLFIAIIAAAIFSNWHVVSANISHVGFGLLALVVALSTVGHFGSRLLGASNIEARTISIETGVQNGALGIAIAGLLVSGGPAFNPYTIPAALYGVVWLTVMVPAVLVSLTR